MRRSDGAPSKNSGIYTERRRENVLTRSITRKKISGDAQTDIQTQKGTQTDSKGLSRAYFYFFKMKKFG
jgi:hypothetical protein